MVEWQNQTKTAVVPEGDCTRRKVALKMQLPRWPTLTLCVYVMFRDLQQLDKTALSFVSWAAGIRDSCEGITAAGQCRFRGSAGHKARVGPLQTVQARDEVETY